MPVPAAESAHEKSPTRRRSMRIALSALVGVAVIAALAIFKPWVPRASADEREAREALSRGNATRALEPIERWLKASPNSAEAHLAKARAMLALDRVPEFAASLKRAEDLKASSNELERIRAILTTKQGKHREAWGVLTREYESETDADPLLSEAVARVFLENYELNKAAQVIDRWMKLSPEDAKPYLWRVEIDSRVPGEKIRLVPDYLEAIKRDPKLARAHIGLAEELLKLHRNAEAAEAYNAYFALRPDDAKAHVGAGANSLEMGDEAGAIAHLDRAISLDPKNAEAFRERAEIDMRRGNYAEGLARFDRAVTIDPFDLDARYNRSIVLNRLGRQDEAKKEREIANKIRLDNEELNVIKEKLIHSPHNIQIQLEVAKWMFDHGHGSDGERWVEKILRATPGQPDACRLVADYHERKGNPGLANFYRLQIDNTPPMARR